MKKLAFLMTVLALTFGVISCDKPVPDNTDQTEQPDKGDGSEGEGDGDGNEGGEGDGNEGGEGDGGSTGTPGTSDLPKFEMPYFDEFPIKADNLFAEGSDVGVTIEVKQIEDNNVVFELRPGAMVQSYVIDVYPIARLYDIFNDLSMTGDIEKGSSIAINENIRTRLFTAGIGGYSFSVNDFENPEDFLQTTFNWMSLDLSLNSPIIPDNGYLIAVVASCEPEISSANQEDMTLCYFHTTSQPVFGDPNVDMSYRTTYTAFEVTYIPNSDAYGFYYMEAPSASFDSFIDIFGEKMLRDVIRSVYSSPVLASDTENLKHSRLFEDAADHTIAYSAISVAVDANLTPQEFFNRSADFYLQEIPENADDQSGYAVITTDDSRVGSSYFEFDVEMDKLAQTVFWGVYSEAEMKAFKEGSAEQREAEAKRLDYEGYGLHNPNFRWDATKPEDERATGTAGTVTKEHYGDLVTGEDIYIGYTVRNGYGMLSDLYFSEAIHIDERNLESSADCKVKDFKLTLTEPTTTSFRQTYTYDPETASFVRFYIQKTAESVLPLDGTWKELVTWLCTDANAEKEPLNLWPLSPTGKDGYVWTGLDPGTEYVIFMVAEDFYGNMTDVFIERISTLSPQVGSDPTVNIEIDGSSRNWTTTFTVDHDVETFFYGEIDNPDIIGLGWGTNGFKYIDEYIAEADPEDAEDAEFNKTILESKLFDHILEYGLSTNSMSAYMETRKTNDPFFAVSVAVGKDDKGEPVYKMNAVFFEKPGKIYTIDELFEMYGAE